MTDHNLDEIIHLVSNQYRRQTIQILRQSPNGGIGFDELLDECCQSTEIDGMHRDHLAIQLHHSHLPKLASGNLISYDQDVSHVRYHPSKQVEEIMDGVSSQHVLPASDD